MGRCKQHDPKPTAMYGEGYFRCKVCGVLLRMGSKVGKLSPCRPPASGGKGRKAVVPASELNGSPARNTRKPTMDDDRLWKVR